MRMVYVSFKEDCLVVPYNLAILLFWGASMNLQRVMKHGFEMYLAKYISKPESSFDIKLSKNPSDPERYLRTRIIGACEALDVQLGFNQYHMSRNTVFLVTEINPSQRLLKTQAQLKALAADSEDVYLQSKFEHYLERNANLYDITYPVYFQWWRKCTYSEQCKAEKDEKKGISKITLGFKGTDEFLELKQSITDRKSVVALFNDRLKFFSQIIKDEIGLQRETLSIIEAAYQHKRIVNNFMECLTKLGFNENYHKDTYENVSNAEKSARAKQILSDAGLLDHTMIYKANKPHWLHEKLIIDGDNIDSISSLSLYKMLETYPAGTMLKDKMGHFEYVEHEQL